MDEHAGDTEVVYCERDDALGDRFTHRRGPRVRDDEWMLPARFARLVQTDGAALRDGEEGLAQQELGVRNAATLAGNFLTAVFNVTLADVVTSRTLPVCRAPDVVVVRLSLPVDQARIRASQRPVHLADAEFESLHREQMALGG